MSATQSGAWNWQAPPGAAGQTGPFQRNPAQTNTAGVHFTPPGGGAGVSAANAGWLTRTEKWAIGIAVAALVSLGVLGLWHKNAHSITHPGASTSTGAQANAAATPITSVCASPNLMAQLTDGWTYCGSVQQLINSQAAIDARNAALNTSLANRNNLIVVPYAMYDNSGITVAPGGRGFSIFGWHPFGGGRGGQHFQRLAGRPDGGGGARAVRHFGK